MVTMLQECLQVRLSEPQNMTGGRAFMINCALKMLQMPRQATLHYITHLSPPINSEGVTVTISALKMKKVFFVISNKWFLPLKKKKKMKKLRLRKVNQIATETQLVSSWTATGNQICLTRGRILTFWYYTIDRLDHYSNLFVFLMFCHKIFHWPASITTSLPGKPLKFLFIIQFINHQPSWTLRERSRKKPWNRDAQPFSPSHVIPW